jgi:hypothetical protein
MERSVKVTSLIVEFETTGLVPAISHTDFAWYLSEFHKTFYPEPLLSVCSSAQKSKLFTTHQISKVNTHRHMCIVLLLFVLYQNLVRNWLPVMVAVTSWRSHRSASERGTRLNSCRGAQIGGCVAHAWIIWSMSAIRGPS